MKRLVLLLAFLFTGLGGARAAAEPAMTFHLQLVHGNDQPTAPTPEAKSIGPKLSKQLRSVFKWEHYWELKRDSVTLKAGEKARKRMSAERKARTSRGSSWCAGTNRSRRRRIERASGRCRWSPRWFSRSRRRGGGRRGVGPDGRMRPVKKMIGFAGRNWQYARQILFEGASLCSKFVVQMEKNTAR